PLGDDPAVARPDARNDVGRTPQVDVVTADRAVVVDQDVDAAHRARRVHVAVADLDVAQADVAPRAHAAVAENARPGHGDDAAGAEIVLAVAFDLEPGRADLSFRQD